MFIFNLGSFLQKTHKCKSCRSRKELSNDSYSNEYLLAKFGFNTAENEPLKVCQELEPKVRIKVRKNIGAPCISTGIDVTSVVRRSKFRHRQPDARGDGGPGPFWAWSHRAATQPKVSGTAP